MSSQISRGLVRGIMMMALTGVAWGSQSKPVQACSPEAYMGSVCFSGMNYCPQGYLEAAGQELPVQQYTALYSLLGFTYGGNKTTTFKLPDLRGKMISGVAPAGLVNRSAFPWGQNRGAEQQVLLANQVPLVAHNHSSTFVAQSGKSQITIPAQTGSGTSLSGTGSVSMVPGIPSGSPATNNPTGSSNYYLTGLKASGTPAGPYTTTAPGSNDTPAKSVQVSVDGSAMVAQAPAVTVGIQTITGGSVAVAQAGGGGGGPVSVLPPQLALTYCIAVEGYYPTKD